jgi:16S rRNA (uracil1498-N3)-methyltransferase
MRIPRVYLQQELASGATVTVSGQTAHHVTHVLRLRERAMLRVFNGDGNEYTATFTGKGRGEITLVIGDPVSTLPEPVLAIRLAQGIARHDRMDLILQKSVELGVSEIQPLWMQRSQSHLRGERLEKRIRHWQGVISSACEQCGRATLPTLKSPLTYPEWLAGNHDSVLGLVLQPDSRTVLADLAQPDGTITLLVGPEGGMNEEEKAHAEAAGFTGVRLGPRILRTETAALAALSGIQTLWGDFR